ncbi:hypothetical protein [Bacillus bombysepticus]|uniref:hypothetical protein n=1 Tax=Bacillus bombysepticus TaxID=658666 RepID=UPI00301A35E9
MSVILSYFISLSGIIAWNYGWQLGAILCGTGWLACVEVSRMKESRKSINRWAIVASQWSVMLYLFLYPYPREYWKGQCAVAVFLMLFAFGKGKLEKMHQDTDSRFEKVWLPWIIPVALFFVWNKFFVIDEVYTWVTLYVVAIMLIYHLYLKAGEKMYFWLSQVGVWVFLSGFTENSTWMAFAIIVLCMWVSRKSVWKYVR